MAHQPYHPVRQVRHWAPVPLAFVNSPLTLPSTTELRPSFYLAVTTYWSTIPPIKTGFNLLQEGPFYRADTDQSRNPFRILNLKNRWCAIKSARKVRFVVKIGASRIILQSTSVSRKLDSRWVFALSLSCQIVESCWKRRWPWTKGGRVKRGRIHSELVWRVWSLSFPRSVH